MEEQFGLLFRTIFLLVFQLATEAKECLKNDDIGWREGNIYTCNNPDQPECCEKDRQFTCCEVASKTKLREQLQLWGVIALFVMMVFVLYMYLRKDVQIFSSATFKESFVSFVRFNKKKDNSIQDSNANTNDENKLCSGKSGKRSLDDDISSSDEFSDDEPICGSFPNEIDGKLNIIKDNTASMDKLNKSSEIEHVSKSRMSTKF